MLCVGAATFGMFFFLTLFMQSVWGYSALKTGLAYLPLTAGIMVSSGAAAQLIPRVGVRPLLLAGAPTTAGGLYWLSRLGEHSSYAGAVLGPMLVIAVGLGFLFVPLTLVAMSKVADQESGVAASLRNTGQQVGGSIGLAVLGTVAWTVVANSIHAQATRAATNAAQRGHPARPSQAALTAIYHHALTAAFSRAFLVTAGIMLLALVITFVAIRVRRADLGGVAAPPLDRRAIARPPRSQPLIAACQISASTGRSNGMTPTMHRRRRSHRRVDREGRPARRRRDPGPRHDVPPTVTVTRADKIRERPRQRPGRPGPRAQRETAPASRPWRHPHRPHIEEWLTNSTSRTRPVRARSRPALTRSPRKAASSSSRW